MDCNLHVSLNSARHVFVALTAIVSAAFAQSTGSITIGGSIPQAISITSSSDGAVSSTVTLGALTATNNATLAQTAPVIVRLRSNQKYKLTASATFTNSGAGADDGGASISPGDIGFGIIALNASGSRVAAGHTDSITTKFDYRSTGFSGLTVNNGLTPFVAGTHGTLADLATGSQIIQGSRISTKGNLNTQDNFLQLTFGSAALPQYFSPTSGFQAVVTFTVVTF